MKTLYHISLAGQLDDIKANLASLGPYHGSFDQIDGNRSQLID